MASFYQLAGTLGSFCIGSSLTLQIYKVIQTKRVDDISLNWQVLYLCGISMVWVYGFMEDLWPVYVPVTLDWVFTMTLLMLKIIYTPRRQP